MKHLKPMEAVAALYASGNEADSEAIVASLSCTIFGTHGLEPARPAKKILASVSHRVLSWTTRTTKSQTADGSVATKYSNRILERSGHGYAHALMGSSSHTTESLVEGGDPMNSQYMMICPEIRKNCEVWDRLFLDSVQAKDVRLRMVWETLATYDEAKRRLDEGNPVRMKAVAAGTGLSMILAYDKLVRDGIDPARIVAEITDRDQANIDKANRLMDKLPTTRERHSSPGSGRGISAKAEDIFMDRAEDAMATYDVVTAIGILEYFHGHTYTTTEECMGMQPPPDAASALDLVHRLHHLTAEGGSAIVNTYRRNAATRLLEVFGRRFDYRNRDNLKALMETAGFKLEKHMGAGHVYDVEVYSKSPLAV
ncbi:hypothetical protein [Roseimicrobium sp. ORNL1]|uniref:hypothetical protein n=1 Tax=Roseimicrobium sp. ORNL1 TaxID=2711231 RepID=UPI0013E1FB78|nr:hypothetical protein [Roseimicrobium sp. ORNL1]QIF04144.1 hypothetical protein G5S37_22310 [Roseimicrobium sp. ORNL1]